MRSLRSQLTLSLVSLLLGVLIVVQLRAQSASSNLENQSVQDLTALIAQLNKGNEDLRLQLQDEQLKLAQLKTAISEGLSATTDVQADIERIRAWAGLEAIQGPGIRLIVTGRLPADAVQAIVNDLWSFGPDGVAVSGVRMVPGVVVDGQPGALTVNGKPIGPSIEITAVGDPDSLMAGLKRVGGVVSDVTVTYPGSGATISRQDKLVLPATDRNLTPRDGSPRL